jgi:hypothetical protein
VAKEAAKVAMRELRQGVVAHETVVRMYMDDAAAEEAHMADDASVTATCELVDGEEMEVEDGDDEEEAEDDAEVRAAEAAIRVASAQREAEVAARAAVELEEHRWAEELIAARMAVELAGAEAERAAHWASQMEKSLT